jgi:hypothetical protein
MSGLRKLAKERSVGPAGAQKVSSSEISGWDFLAKVCARPEEEAAAGRLLFLSKGFSGDGFLLLCNERPVSLADLWTPSSSDLSEYDFLLPVKARPRDGAVADRCSFLAKDLSGGDFFLSLDGRAGAAVLDRWTALLGFLVGVFLLTDKGSPRRRKGREIKKVYTPDGVA